MKPPLFHGEGESRGYRRIILIISACFWCGHEKVDFHYVMLKRTLCRYVTLYLKPQNPDLECRYG